MVTRNIVIGGMTGGAGHVGMVTQGYGGTYVEPELHVLSAVVKQVRRSAVAVQSKITARVIQKVRKAR